MSQKWLVTKIDDRMRGGAQNAKVGSYNAARSLIASCTGPASSAAAMQLSGLTTYFPNKVYGGKILGMRTAALARGEHRITPGTSYTTSALRLTTMSGSVVAAALTNLSATKLIVEFVGN